jgi:hypothetical protein
MKRCGGGNGAGGSPSDINEALEGELAAASESIEPVHATKATLSTKSERVVEAGRESNPRIDSPPGIYLFLPGERNTSEHN